MDFQPLNLVFRELKKEKALRPVFSAMERGKQILSPDFFIYIVRHILAKERKEGIKLEKNNDYSLIRLKKQFLGLGYEVSPFIYEAGQMSVRGEIIDFWDKTALYPIRLEFFDRTLEQIYFFDLRTKKPIHKISSFFVYPCKFKKFRDSRIIDLPIRSHLKSSLRDIIELSQDKNQKIFIFSRFEASLRDLIRKNKAKIYFLPPQNSPGFSFKNLHFFTDLDFERKVKIRRFAEIKDFSVGDYVVHIDHGIAKLDGIGPKKLPLSLDEQILGQKERKDFYYHLRFKNSAFLYAPLLEKRRITKYIGSNPSLSVLGGKEWQEAKIAARNEAKKLAIKLFSLYSELKKQRSEINPREADEYLKILDRSFSYELTLSQKKILKNILKKLKKQEVLDFLLSGEASSGKTEVALRLASVFLASQKQAIFLAPTTFLAYQQYLVAKNRFKKLPLKVGILSRFQTHAENSKTIEQFNSLKIDFLVGTHKILYSKLNLKNLGFLIIDEEQRFGVSQKEKIRLIKKDISVLSLTATPIPRTLHLAFSGLKSMGNLGELPFAKAKIKESIIGQKNWRKIEKIIENNKKSPIFFVAPFIRDLHYLEPKLRKIFKKKRIIVAHARMERKKLAQIYSDFSLGKIDILLSTPIVEHGLDISLANLMILWYGERFGLADLYQLRGRIGRIGQKALFLVAVPEKISDSSYSRLIDFLSLVKTKKPGWEISMKDLERRGEGEILGKRQHGIVNQVGLYLFSNLLKHSIKKIAT